MLANRAPKFGNDIQEADRIARQVGEHFCRTVLNHRGIRGGRFKPGLFSFTNFLPAGKGCGALPDGGRARRPFANGVSPTHGADRNGPTAMLRSASKLNYTLSPNANTLDLKLSPASVKDGAGVARLGDMIRTYFQMGGMQLQLSVLSSEDLRQAQLRPDDYADLLVRVAGYSAHFVSLDREVQEEIIRRSEHAL
jgi:formate C-acetyltransferase